jgi:hypothetical protein
VTTQKQTERNEFFYFSIEEHRSRRDNKHQLFSTTGTVLYRTDTKTGSMTSSQIVRTTVPANCESLYPIDRLLHFVLTKTEVGILGELHIDFWSFSKRSFCFGCNDTIDSLDFAIFIAQTVAGFSARAY